jgi:hypothetical protein
VVGEVTAFPDESTVTRWEALAHAAREAMAGARELGVTASYTPEVQATNDALRAALAEAVGEEAARLAWGQWAITDRPIADLAWWWRLTPGTRVVHRYDGRHGVVRAGDADGMAEVLGEWMQRWVLWDGEDEPVLVRTVDLVPAH